jgi:hypothetical protein
MMAFAPVFGDLAQDEPLVAEVARALELIRSGGVAPAAARLTGGV